MRHINALLNADQSRNLDIILHDALDRANDSILSHPLDSEEIEELQEVLL